ncbi:MAG TPA: hypothetical protein PKC18_15460, partial [Lacipirellulaceae bacterium]|nr:hypothetical protein [Lacipirellulaceae bacterium]
MDDSTPVQSDTPPSNPLLDPENAPLPKRGWLRKYPGFTFLLPFAVFLIVGSVEPSPPEERRPSAAADGGREVLSLDEQRAQADQQSLMPYEYYPRVYTTKIVLTTLAMLAVLPGYLAFPGRVHGMAWVVGAVGAVVWVALSKLQVATYPMLPKFLADLLEMGGR